MSISQATIVGLPQPQSWDEYERGCLASFGGGYQSESDREIFRHGMATVFNLLRDEFPPAGVCKTASPLEVVTCVYCGHEYGPDTPASNHPALTEHIAQCPKHPMRAVVEQRDALLAACEAAADELIAATWEVSREKRPDLEYAANKCRAAIAKVKGTTHA